MRITLNIPLGKYTLDEVIDTMAVNKVYLDSHYVKDNRVVVAVTHTLRTEDQVQESLGKACLQLGQDYIQWFIHEKRVGHCIGPHVVDHFDPSTFYHFGA